MVPVKILFQWNPHTNLEIKDFAMVGLWNHLLSIKLDGFVIPVKYLCHT